MPKWGASKKWDIISPARPCYLYESSTFELFLKSPSLSATPAITFLSQFSLPLSTAESSNCPSMFPSMLPFRNPKMAQTDGISKRPRIQWDTTKRQVLCCLYRFFSWEKQTLCRVFSEIFRQHLLELGIKTDLSYPLLHTQWSTMRQELNPVWFHVHIDTDFRSDAEWRTRITEIKATASQLGVSLQEKAWDNIDKLTPKDFDYENDKKLNAYFESILLSVRTESIGDTRVSKPHLMSFCIS